MLILIECIVIILNVGYLVKEGRHTLPIIKEENYSLNIYIDRYETDICANDQFY